VNWRIKFEYESSDNITYEDMLARSFVLRITAARVTDVAHGFTNLHLCEASDVRMYTGKLFTSHIHSMLSIYFLSGAVSVSCQFHASSPHWPLASRTPSETFDRTGDCTVPFRFDLTPEDFSGFGFCVELKVLF
jgi:hypothetical protein